MLRLADLDHVKIGATLIELESMLDQSDLRPLHARLRAEQQRSLRTNRRPPRSR